MRVLAVAAHPGDEVLGAGATLARHAREGHPVDIVLCAPGTISRDRTADEIAQLLKLKDQAREAARRLGARPPVFLDFPANAMDSVPLQDVVRRVEAAIAELRPEVVYTHHPGDLDVDHQLTARAVLSACRPLPGSTVRAIHAWETLSSTEWAPPQLTSPFLPHHFVDVEATLGSKLNALACYEGELRPFPHPRSAEAVRHLAGVRGATAGLQAAEAFETLRSIWR
ncbi:MAG: PIG-L family deacetylase [Vicinamibacteria bacterium]|nr:PIG-L family deacetylase [Vicinamibacteria bacterium]